MSGSASITSLFPKKRRRTPGQEGVQTIVAGTGFPVSSKRPRDSLTKPAAAATTAETTTDGTNTPSSSLSTAATTRTKGGGGTKKHEKLLDWHETVREVRKLGAAGFVKKQKRDYEDEEYKRLTGRERKRQYVPLPILRGIKKKRIQREATAMAEARAAGMAVPKSLASSSTNKETKLSRQKKQSRKHGPAPSIGFVKKGVLQVKKKPV